MSLLRRERAEVAAVSGEDLDRASAALAEAVGCGGTQLPDAPRTRAEAVVEKVGRRTALLGGHTVVALAGATGSGKSSLFNALVGEEVSTVGARRPTTSTPTAAVWGDEPAGDLLDWLGVDTRHLVGRSVQDPGADPDEPDNTAGAGADAGTGAPGHLGGLVLLDLPDFDSREVSHRVEAERVLDLVDLFVWVTDPQKYADARLHDDHVAALATHDAVTIVVLNQADRLSRSDLQACTEDLQRLMTRDGMRSAPVLATSATTGEGLGGLRQRLADAVAGGSVSRARLAADIRASCGALRPAVSDSEPVLDAADEAGLVDALARSAGVPTVVAAVERDYRMAALARTGWPFTRWVQGLRPRPLRRLRLDGEEVRITQSDVRSVLGRSSLPAPSPAARAGVTLASRRVGDRAGADLPRPWAEAVDDAATSPGDALADALDQAVVRTPLRDRDPVWWRVLGGFQLVLALVATAGLLWLLLLMVLGWLQLPEIGTPAWGPLPVPFVLLAGGVLAGLLLALLARFLARVGGRRRARAVRRRLHASIAGVADDQIVGPVADVLRRHRKTREALERAASV